MSWNKNTIVTSSLDGIVSALKVAGVPYTLTVRGEVYGRGLNDPPMFPGDDREEGMYPLRRLEFASVVIMEQMVRTEDCDADDYLISQEFPKEKVPEDFPLEDWSEMVE